MPSIWTEHDKHLEAKFTFKDFSQAFAFMTEVAFAAERQQHHPDWNNVWNKVEIRLNTHSAGNIVTEKDWLLANEISRIFERFSATH